MRTNIKVNTDDWIIHYYVDEKYDSGEIKYRAKIELKRKLLSGSKTIESVSDNNIPHDVDELKKRLKVMRRFLLEERDTDDVLKNILEDIESNY